MNIKNPRVLYDHIGLNQYEKSILLRHVGLILCVGLATDNAIFALRKYHYHANNIIYRLVF